MSILIKNNCPVSRFSKDGGYQFLKINLIKIILIVLKLKISKLIKNLNLEHLNYKIIIAVNVLI